jgi:prepilin peptidase CpaA
MDNPLLVLPAALLLTAALCDLKSRTIPDAVSAALALSGGAWALTGAGAAQTAGLAALVFLGGVALHRLGQLGGGDVKLAAAATLWVGPDGFVPFMVLTAILGGAVCLTAALARFAAVAARDGAGPALRAARAAQAPYAVALAGGGVAALPWAPQTVGGF